jgi:hypothetical protein
LGETILSFSGDLGGMNSTQTKSIGARITSVALLIAAVVLVVGVSTAAAAARKPHITISTSPVSPAVGKTFSITFQLVRNGVALPFTGPDCLGMTNGRAIPLASKTTNGLTATCTWNIPSTKVGPTFDGMLVAFDAATGVEYYYGYDLPIR